MKLLKNLVPFFSIILSFSVSAQVPEIADPQLNDIAMVQPHPQYGAVIIYNPIICQQIGAACGFFRAHEYGHVALNHQFLHPGAYPAIREAQADQWAAINGIPQEILAAYYLFLNGGSSSNYQVYGHPQQRATRLRQYAIQAGNWIGP
jgi:hypothetical protein